MDVLRTGCSFLGSIEPEVSFKEGINIAERLLAVFPSVLAYWYRFSHKQARIATDDDANSLAGHFLTLLRGHAHEETAGLAVGGSWSLFAQHEFNASSLAGRRRAGAWSACYPC